VDRIEFRDAVKHERRIELAFEDHRYWDLIRWKDAETVLNKPVTGVKVISKDEILIGVDDEENELYAYVYNYQVVDVAPRVFRPHHYYLPFSRAEVENSKGTLQQNDGYN
ncbi:MAG: RagB/SusD family nutrient uptake outer membrane protein, partial [Bacteroidales bacterium]|nr:RagB/SusD family nutrient uptake outer membrane protein [Bacteroidales bacterium]